MLFGYLELKRKIDCPPPPNPHDTPETIVADEPSNAVPWTAISQWISVAFLTYLSGSPLPPSYWSVVVQVTVDTLTLGLMVWASILDPDVSGDKRRIDSIYVGCMLIQVGGPWRKFVFLYTLLGWFKCRV